ncbi:MAG: hypothetical protein COB38_05550 [Gammaproteobacteria bacterium]|nr:MAG: hypothetical protein COB38_05550 [Gammaproteobacteria bacterium]
MIIHRQKLVKILFFITVGFLSSNSFSADENTAKQVIEQSKIEETKIEETVLGMNVSGNKEAPNLLYIIPWKDSAEHQKPPEINRLMDEVFSTVDPDVYEKELGFYQQLAKVNSSILNKE